MKFIYTLLIFGLILNLQAQDFVQVSVENGYAVQAFYNLQSQDYEQVINNEWDLAFSAMGTQDAAIHINESSQSSFTAPTPQIELYLAPTDNFEDPIDPSSLTDLLFNPDSSWAWGAFNTVKQTANPLDYGWGAYNPAERKVEGQKVFLIRLRNLEYKKLMIESLAGTTYNVRVADPDGGNEYSFSLNKMDAQGPLMYYSLENEREVDFIPANWDLLFCRYVTPLDDGTGAILDYTVTGVLHAPGIEVAEMRDRVPATIGLNDGEGLYEPNIDVIGADWKFFDFSAGWVLMDSLSFMVKTQGQKVYLIEFIDFEGINTGVITFKQTLLGTITNTTQKLKALSWTLGPNPGSDFMNFELELEEADPSLSVSIFDLQGKLISLNPHLEQNGNRYRGMLDVSNLKAGMYQMVLNTEKGVMSRSLIKI